MPETKGSLRNHIRAAMLVLIIVAVVIFAVRNIDTFGNIILVTLGFGAVIMIHEFGHFIVAKLSDIKVEAFSIGFPPVLFAIQKTEQGLRFSVLPERQDEEEEQYNETEPSAESQNGQNQKEKKNALFSFTLGKCKKAGETDYRIGLVPFGGFVKMLGQDDTGADEVTDDPRSFSNKPISTRIAVVTAGVLFNAISALIVFCIVFLVGIELTPPIIGSVQPDSPAAVAGLVAGDRIIQINNSTNLDFSNIPIAAALSGRDEAVNLKVQREDGTLRDFSIVPKPSQTSGLRLFGIGRPAALTIENVSNPKALLNATGLKPGDKIIAANGKEVQNRWQLEEIVKEHIKPNIKLTVKRSEPKSDRQYSKQTQVSLSVTPTSYSFTSEYSLNHICAMVPRLRIAEVEKVKPPSILEKILALFKVPGCRRRQTPMPIKKGDILTAVGDIENPTFKELRETTGEYENKPMHVGVLRADADGVLQPMNLEVTPRKSPGSDRVHIGIITVLDIEHPVVATTISAADGPEPLSIPRGSKITRAGNFEISNFYDLVGVIRSNLGKQIELEWQKGEQNSGIVELNIPAEDNYINVKSTFTEFIPFKEYKELYKATGPVNAIQMGLDKTLMFIAQAYTTIKGLLARLVSPKTLVGPLGIFKLTYTIVSEQPLSYYFYFLGLISAIIAVMNFLPLPILDGGIVVLLLIEKLKGSPISVRTQTALTYAGLVFIAALFLYVTRNDIINFFLN